MITIAGGVLACSMQMMGRYPLAPAYFAAAFLEGVSGVWLTAAMYIGMLLFYATDGNGKIRSGASCDRRCDQTGRVGERGSPRISGGNPDSNHDDDFCLSVADCWNGKTSRRYWQCFWKESLYSER